MVGALADFLPRERRGDTFEVLFELPPGLRDLVQSVGVPHVEVGTTTVDGEPAAWSRRVDDGAVVEAHPRYPLSEAPDCARFLADAHLGRLTAYLRLAGIDVLHDPALDDPALVSCSVDEERILLTRDRQLLMIAALQRGSYVRSTDPPRQAVEVVRRFALSSHLLPFTRCMVCNCELEQITAAEAGGRVPPAVLTSHDAFRRCPGCERVYWEGSHHARLQRLVELMRTA
jgi:uncharacterized protein with PIN domain